MAKRKLALAIAILLVAAAGYLLWWWSDSAGPDVLTEINPDSLGGLKDDFNRAAASVRAIVLLSPS